MISNFRDGFDYMGVLAGSACVIHCVFIAFAPATFLASSMSGLFGHEAEWFFALVATLTALTAAWPAFRRKHSFKGPILLVIGVVFLCFGRLVEEKGAHFLGTALSVVAGLVLVGGHLFNLKGDCASGSGT